MTQPPLHNQMHNHPRAIQGDVSDAMSVQDGSCQHHHPVMASTPAQLLCRTRIVSNVTSLNVIPQRSAPPGAFGARREILPRMAFP